MKKQHLCCERRPYTSPSGFTSPRSFSSLLRTGNLAAHTVHRLMLLDPSPDMVHGSALRKTRSSTQEKELIRRRSALRRGIHPCCSGLQVQGSAISPAGMAYFHSRNTADRNIIPYFKEFCKRYRKDSRKFHKSEVSRGVKCAPAWLSNSQSPWRCPQYSPRSPQTLWSNIHHSLLASGSANISLRCNPPRLR